MIRHPHATEYQVKDLDRRYVGANCTFGGVAHHPVIRLNLDMRPVITPACGQGALMSETALRPSRRPATCRKCVSWVKRHGGASVPSLEPLAGFDDLLAMAALP